MKKHGFSMAELLVALTIIAVGAAILIPSYLALRPDKYKFKVLSYYNAVNEVTENLLENSAIYFRKPIDDEMPEGAYNDDGTLNPDYQYGCNGLGCVGQPEVAPYNTEDYLNYRKYPNLLLDMLNLQDTVKFVENPNHNDLSHPVGSATGRLPDGSYWVIEAYKNEEKYPYDYRITIDMNSESEGPNCVYDVNNCKSPDKFVFYVDNIGDISGDDPLTKVYINNMTNLDKAEDYTEASH